VTAALRVLVALVFSFLWLRRQEVGEGPALAGALAYGLGGFLMLWLGWPIANSAALLPVLLYAVARMGDPGGRRDALLLALAALALLLGGHPETLVYALGLGFVFLLDRARRLPPGERLRPLRDAALAFLLAGAVAAPALLPALDLIPHSLRAARLADPAADGHGLAESLLPIAAPNAYGNSRYIHYWGRMNSNEDASGFVGTATLLAALLAVGARRKLPQEWVSLGIALLCLLALAFPPGLPLAGRRLLLPLSLCLVHLAACTLERFRRGEAQRWPVVLVAAGLASLLAWGYLTHPDPADPARLEVLRLGWLRWQSRFLGLAVLLLLAAATWKRWRGLAVAALALPMAAELILAHGPVNPPMPRRLAFPDNEPIRFLRLHLQIGRTDGPGYRMAALGRDFPPNQPALYGFPDARVYNPMAPADYFSFLEPVLTGWSGEAPEFGNPGHPLYARLGVRYLLAAPGRRLPPPLTRVLADPAGWIWEIPQPRPRLFPFPPARGARLRIPRLEAQWITSRVDPKPGQSLRSNLYQDGGWRLLVDGVRRPTTREDGPFLAAALPEGESRLDLLYRPGAFLWGCLIAAAGLAAGVVWLAPRPIPIAPARPLPSAEPR
jgi:hypothetical protein